MGGGGAQPCNILVVKCNDWVAVFHFYPSDSPSKTLGKFLFPKGCKAIICGGDDSTDSNCLGDELVKAVGSNGIKLDGVSPNSGCGVLANGNWFQHGD